MMKTVFFLRVASGLTLVQAAAHTIGGVFGDPGPGPAAAAVQAMKMNQFLLMGNTRSYWDFYRGLGLGATISLTAEAILLWQLASLAKTDAARLRPILITFLVAYTALGVNSYLYFFLGPVIAETLIVTCLGFAIATAKSQAA